MQEKTWYYEKWGGRHASFPPRRSVKCPTQYLHFLQYFFPPQPLEGLAHHHKNYEKRF